MKPVFLLKIYSILWNDYNEIRGKRKSFFNTGFSFQKCISKNFVYFNNLTYLNEERNRNIILFKNSLLPLDKLL